MKGNGHPGSGKVDGDTLAHPKCSENLSAGAHFIVETKGPCFGFCLFFQQPVTTHLFLTALEGTTLSRLGLLCASSPHLFKLLAQTRWILYFRGVWGGG